MIAQIIYMLLSVFVAGLCRGILVRKHISLENSVLNIDVTSVVIIVAVFVTLNVFHFLIKEYFFS